MTDLKQFKLPDVGEGLTEGEILKWYVQPGDTVVVNQTIVEIETAKAAVELPSPWAGVVTELLADEGSTVDVGTPIITVDTDPSGEPAVAMPTSQAPAQPAALGEDLIPNVPTPAQDEAVEPGLIGGPAPGGRTSVLVGYGPRSVEAKRRPRKQEPASSVAAAVPTASAAPTAAPPAEVTDMRQAAPAQGTVTVPAKPPVRKLARDLGVDLTTVLPSGPDGTVTREDVQAALAGDRPAAAAAPAASAGAEGRETRIPIRSVRRATAQAMVKSAFTAPHVTEWVSVDVTRSMDLLDTLAARREFRDLKLSPLTLVAKAVLLGVRRHPDINASWDEDAQEIVVKRYVNLGIAAATERGLVVPNIKDADRLSLAELAQAITDLAGVARGGKTPPADMVGGTITITNVGVFGVDGGTPILPPGEAAILAAGAVRDMPWVVDGQLAVRKVMQLSLSFDHRLVDGELGSRFLADIAAVLENPTLALAWA